jgi:hypothetical protein
MQEELWEWRNSANYCRGDELGWIELTQVVGLAFAVGFDTG